MHALEAEETAKPFQSYVALQVLNARIHTPLAQH